MLSQIRALRSGLRSSYRKKTQRRYGGIRLSVSGEGRDQEPNGWLQARET